MQSKLRLSSCAHAVNFIRTKIQFLAAFTTVFLVFHSDSETKAQGTTCSTAVVINCGENVTSTTAGIPNDNSTSGAFLCNTSVGTGGQRWFSLTPTASGPITISLVETATNFDTKLHLYSGVCGNLTCVAGNDDFDPNNEIYSSQLTNISLQEGVTYLIRVGGFQGETGIFNLSISSCEGAVPGCTDNTACNFLPSANVNDNSCIYPGCNVEGACNYNPDAGCDDGSCCFATCNQISVTSGTFPTEIGWTVFSPSGVELASGGAPVTGASVCVNEPSCNYSIVLTDAFGDGWNGAFYTITSPSGTVEATGTLNSDNIADPNPLDQVGTFNIALGGAIAGCTDINANNYDAAATCDNGSCVACSSNQALFKLILEDSFGDGWNGAEYTIVDNNDINLLSGTLSASSLDSVITCLATGCYRIDVTNGIFPEEISWSIINTSGIAIVSGFAGESVPFGWNGADGCVIEGCTDVSACNYLEGANVDDGSCNFPGCTDNTACNYDPIALCDNGACCFNSCINLTVTSGDFPGEIGWQLFDTADNLISEGGAPAAENICLTTPICGGQFLLFDAFGDGWNGAVYTFEFENDVQATGTLASTLEFNQVTVNLGSNILGCTDNTAVNYDNLATCDNGGCLYAGCTDFMACNFDINATVDDASCIYPGCTDENACNFVSDAGCDDLSCIYADQFLDCEGNCLSDIDNDGVCNEFEITGCQDAQACNYDSTATDADLCSYASPFLDCAGNCLIDTDLDGICNEFEIPGCTDVNACNFNVDATDDDATCVFPEPFTDCEGNCINDLNANNICDENEIGGCTDVTACNFDSNANTDNQTCLYPGCNDPAACNYFEGSGCPDGSCEYPGCTLPDACNFDEQAACDDASCILPGCTDILACNYDESAVCSGVCLYAQDFFDCAGNCLNDTDLDGVCNELEIGGCTDLSACNYNELATDDNGTCDYPVEFFDCEGNCLFDIDNDGICDPFDQEGCTDPSACNWNPASTVNDNSCIYPGCSDPAACNYDASAGCSNESCEFPGCSIVFACNYSPEASCFDDLTCVGGPGTPCEDGDPFTVGETFDENCNCIPATTQTVFDIIAGSAIHNILETAIITAGLDNVLSSPGAYTVFAPTDEAFNNLPAGTIPALLADTTGLLSEILLYHTVGAIAPSTVLEDGMLIATLQGQDVIVTINTDGIFINDAEVIVADILADNGIVHVIDAVLLPTITENNTIFDIVANSTVHNTLESALLASGLNTVLSEPGNYTLFAPTDAAFAALPAGTVEALLADAGGALTQILLYHTVNGVALSTDLSDGLLIPTLQGQDLTVTINSNGVFINNAQVIIADIIADNGVVHVIDAVLIPGSEISGCTDISACNFTEEATNDDGSCIYGSCTIPDACNYDANASCADDALCNFGGCTEPSACNYNDNVACDDGSCIFPEPTFDCEGNCLNDADLDLICDENEIFGCNDPFACNYNAAATENDNTCEYSSSEFYDCDSVCYFDNDSDGICDAFESVGCTDVTACNYNPFALEDDGGCSYPGCTDSLACNYTAGLICDDGSCVFPGCTVSPSCNYDPDAGCDDGSCLFGGCTDSTACNFDNSVSCNDGSCFYDSPYEDCNGICYNDVNDNGICDEYEVPGCTDPTACNYSPIAIFDNGLCTYPGCDDPGACNYIGFVGCPDESCIYPGCTDEFACNFNALTICDDGSCVYPGCTDTTACNFDPFAGCNGFNCIQPNFPFDCSGQCINDSDLDEVCDENEIQGCEDNNACNYNPQATEDDGSCTYPADFLNCDGSCLSDQDDDGICDNLESDGCTDSLACNYNSFASNNDNTCVYPGCTEITACNFNPVAGCLDESCIFPQIFQDCFGNCINDLDSNQICDELEQPGCTDVTACNYDPFAASDNGSCSYPGCTDEMACNYNEAAGCEDGTCTYPGCMIPEACNYDAAAQCDDGLCEFPGCNIETACNYDPIAICADNGLCVFPEPFVDCAGNCINDSDLDFVCDELEIAGCLDSTACNFNVLTTDIVTCEYPEEFYNCDGDCQSDNDNDGICDEIDVEGCTDPTACNYNAFALIDDNMCTYPGCTDTMACNYQIEAACEDGSCLFPGCTDSMACNFDATASCDGGECIFPSCGDVTACNYDASYVCGSQEELCTYPAQFYTCDSICIDDTDQDAVCDSLEILGCTDINACNYNSNATESSADCAYPEEYYNCDGSCTNDADGDGICDVIDLVGCTDPTACNYNPSATESDNSCLYPGCTDTSACNFNEAAACDDESCIVSGCLDSLACNYNPTAGCDNGSCEFPACQDPEACNYISGALCGEVSLCEFPEQYLNCEGFCIDDQDSDGICDPFDLQGCTDSLACNYNSFATEFDNSCTYAFEFYTCEGICINDEDNDGVCTELEIAGCTDFAACNYNPFATEEDSTCTYPETYYNCNGICLQDSDNDSICDPLDDTGCTDSLACNYNPFAVISSGDCTYAIDFYNCDGICLMDSDNDGICDELEVPGCIIPSACNFNTEATDYDSSCVFPGCTDAMACNYDPTAGCDDNSCYSPLDGFLCDGSCDGDADGDGLCDFFETNGCTDSLACNYNPYATANDLTCTFPGCNDPNACNFDPNAGCTFEGACELPVPFYNCDGSCVDDADADGICDPFETSGCTDPLACNYNAFVTIDDGSCAEQIFATENISVTSDSFPDGYEWNGALLLTSGEYIWVGTSANGCDSVVTLIFEYTVVIGLNENSGAQQISLWPNPAKDILNVIIENGSAIDYIELLDIHGKMVMQERNTQTINVSTLESGIYLVRVHADQYLMHKRIEVIR